jgi:hypothetical protein
MNDITREFAKQAGFYKYGDDFEDIIEKFAELIVRECVKIAYQNDVAKFTRDGYVIGQEIEKHFGVDK